TPRCTSGRWCRGGGRERGRQLILPAVLPPSFFPGVAATFGRGAASVLHLVPVAHVDLGFLPRHRLALPVARELPLELGSPGRVPVSVVRPGRVAEADRDLGVLPALDDDGRICDIDRRHRLGTPCLLDRVVGVLIELVSAGVQVVACLIPVATESLLHLVPGGRVQIGPPARSCHGAHECTSRTASSTVHVMHTLRPMGCIRNLARRFPATRLLTTMLLMLTPVAASAADPVPSEPQPDPPSKELRWNEDWPRFRPLEYVVTGVVGP